MQTQLSSPGRRVHRHSDELSFYERQSHEQAILRIPKTQPISSRTLKSPSLHLLLGVFEDTMRTATVPRKILIVGAGLGGLCSSIALQTDGNQVTLIDSAPEFVEVWEFL